MASTLEMVTQEAIPQRDWPYKQDWIVKAVKHWPGGGGLCLIGENTNRPVGDPDRNFRWLFSASTIRHRPFDWRFDFTGAVFD